MIEATQTEVTTGRRYWGKFRGSVINNVDPKGEGRLMVAVPEISSTPLLNWAPMSLPVGGPQHGIFSVPPLGTKVWVEFEGGDVDYPVIAGYRVDAAANVPSKAPPANPLLHAITLQTPTQNGIVISDNPGPLGGVQITTRLNQKITVTDLGIEIDNGLGASIKMIGPTIQIDAAQVSINQGALSII